MMKISFFFFFCRKYANFILSFVPFSIWLLPALALWPTAQQKRNEKKIVSFNMLIDESSMLKWWNDQVEWFNYHFVTINKLRSLLCKELFELRKQFKKRFTIFAYYSFTIVWNHGMCFHSSLIRSTKIDCILWFNVGNENFWRFFIFSVCFWGKIKSLLSVAPRTFRPGYLFLWHMSQYTLLTNNKQATLTLQTDSFE